MGGDTVRKRGVCIICGIDFEYYESNRATGKYCSLKCAHKSPERIEKIRIANTGKKASEQARRNMSLAHIGKNIGPESHSWKGDNIKYQSLHAWVRANFDKPGKCEKCGTKKGKAYEWANKSGKYKRRRSDWFWLCKKCHHKYDGVGEKASKTFLDRKDKGEYELRAGDSGRLRWFKKKKI